MKLLGLVGQPGSGKDTAAEYIARHYMLRHIASGDVLRSYITTNNLGALDRENMQSIITSLRRSRGDAVLVQIALKEVGENEHILVSGLRHPTEGEIIAGRGGHMIAITAPIKQRYARTKRRGREGDNISIEQFTRLEQNENKGQTFNIKQLIDSAEFTISNDGDYRQFIGKIDRLMKRLGFEKH